MATATALSRRVFFLMLAAFLALQAAPFARYLPGVCGDDGMEFLGFPHIPTDHIQYMDMAAQAAAGEHAGGLVLENRMTTEAQEPRHVLLLLTAVGWVQRALPVGLPVVWHALRVAMVLAVVLVLRRWLARLDVDRATQAAAFFLLLFSAGAEWIPRTAGWLADSNAVQNPWNFSFFHFSFIGMWLPPLLLLLALVWAMLHRRHAIAGTVPLVLWLFHPYAAMLGAVVLAAGAVMLWRRGCWTARDLGRAAGWAVPSLGGIAGLVLWARTDPVYAEVSEHVFRWELTYWPHLYLLVYGPQLLLLIPGWKSRGDDGGPAAAFFPLLRVWLVAGALLSLNPWVTGAKFQPFMIVPLALLEARGWTRLCARWPVLRRPAVAAALGLFVSLGTVCNVLSDPQPAGVEHHVLRPRAEVELLAALADEPAGNVLCSSMTGELVPWLTGRKTFIGHWFMTPDVQGKVNDMRRFFRADGDMGWKQRFLRANGIRYVIMGPWERKLGFALDPRLPLRHVASRGSFELLEAVQAAEARE